VLPQARRLKELKVEGTSEDLSPVPEIDRMPRQLQRVRDEVSDNGQSHPETKLT
jgi:hypothetical protein